MGRDKATLEVAGERLVDRLVRIAGQVADVTVVASGARTIPGLAVDQIPDEIPDGGPLPGLVSGLRVLADRGCDLAIALAVDLPFASAAVLRAALATLDDTDLDAVVPDVDGWLQPLHAVYRTSAVGPFESAVTGGVRSLLVVLDGLRVHRWQGWEVLDPSGRFARNVNTPEELAAAVGEL